MRRLRVAIVDLLEKGPCNSLWARAMQPNFASIMPQVIGVWCEQAGHDVTLVCYTGREDLTRELPDDTDLVFIASYTQTAHLAYALANIYRKRGTATALGGSHARCYPDDAARYFDYVLGFTDRAIIDEVLKDCAPHRPTGLRLSAKRQPAQLPGVRERWKFIEATIAKASVIKIIPMIGSLGCPYTCSFCIDAAVDYQPLDTCQIRDDLRFLLSQVKRPMVGWHDPNFGVRFDEIMTTIEAAVPPDRIDFLAESSLSLLSEPHLQRLKRNGFKAILPGIESWYSLGGKAKTGSSTGLEKVRQVSDHVNTILRYVPYVQANFVLGLDDDVGEEPFELSKLFVDMTPGVFPAYSLLSAFGQAAPLNLELQRDGRVLPTPFHFLDNNQATNVRPKNYTWPALYDNIIGLRRHSFSWGAIGRRIRANRVTTPGLMNFVRAVSEEGFGRIRHDTTVRRLLDHDTSVRCFFEGESEVLPTFYTERVRKDLGHWWDALPEGSLRHDPNAYLKAHEAAQAGPATFAAARPGAVVRPGAAGI
ncbi:MAG TPA: radical SAM protein [Vicinamibacteria bacterium]|nr:radical SAM protein [Vicinamibacteria bacterium]